MYYVLCTAYWIETETQNVSLQKLTLAWFTIYHAHYIHGTPEHEAMKSHSG